MTIKYYVDRWTINGVWVRISAGIDSLVVAENLKSTLAARYADSIDNFSIVCTVC